MTLTIERAPERIRAPHRKLEDSGRVTPREVLEAYNATGMKACTGTFLTVGPKGQMFGCGIGVVVLRRRGEPGHYGFMSDMERRMAAGGVYATPTREAAGYADGFVSAFDGGGSVFQQDLPVRHPARVGARDGARARRFVDARGMMYSPHDYLPC